MKLVIFILLISSFTYAQQSGVKDLGPTFNNGSSGVSSLNSLTGALNIIGGTGITVTPSGSNITISSSGGGGTVTSVSVVSANGLAGTVANPTTTPAITLSTSITGILQGNGTAISAASTTGSGNVVLSTSPTLVTPALGTPSALVGTNITGTAAGLTAGSVTTNANLTGPITSVGNATSIAAQTGNGSTFVVSQNPSITTSTTSGVPLTLTGVASQTGDLLDIKNSSGSILDSISSAGYFLQQDNESTGTLPSSITLFSASATYTGTSYFNTNGTNVTGFSNAVAKNQASDNQTGSPVFYINSMTGMNNDITDQVKYNLGGSAISQLTHAGIVNDISDNAVNGFAANNLAIVDYGIENAFNISPFTTGAGTTTRVVTGIATNFSLNGGAFSNVIGESISFSFGTVTFTGAAYGIDETTAYTSAHPVYNVLAGSTTVGTNANPAGTFDVNVPVASRVGITVNGIASQTADLQDWNTSTPTTVAKVDKSGNFFSQSINLGSNLTLSSTAPTVSSGFGTSPTVGTGSTAASMDITVGSSPGSTGVITLPTAAHTWVCHGTDQTTLSYMVQTAQTTTSVTFTNYSVTLGTALSFTASDLIIISCLAH